MCTNLKITVHNELQVVLGYVSCGLLSGGNTYQLLRDLYALSFPLHLLDLSLKESDLNRTYV